MLRTTLARGWIVPVLAALFAVGGVGSSALAADRWTNLAGTSTVSAEMIGLWNGRVLLQLEGGRRVSVRMEDLRADSRIQAEKRLVEIQQRLQQRRAEIAQAAQAAEASAPAILAELPPAPSYAVPSPGADLRTTLQAIRDQVEAGHLRVLYDTLPASYQQKTDELVALALAKFHAASFETVRSNVHGFADMIVTRQRWLFSHPRLAQLPDDQQQAVIVAAELIRTLTSEDVLSLTSFRSRPFGESVALLDDALSPHLYRLASEYSDEESASMPDFEIVAGTDGVSSVKFVGPVAGPTSTLHFKSLEGRWLLIPDPKAPGAAAAGDIWESARAGLASVGDESLRLPPAADLVLQMFTAAIAPLQQAKSQHEFHRALDELLPQFAALVNQFSGFTPAPRPGAPSTYDPSNLYDSSSGSLNDSSLSGTAETMP